MNNLGFQIRGDINNPFHLSVGIVIKDNGNLALIRKNNGYLTIPRETMFSLESIEDAVRRGAIEELGIEVHVDKFIGALITHFKRPDGTDIEKTTIYFLAKKSPIKKERKPKVDEVNDKIVWINLEEAVRILRSYKNPEYKILERALS